MPSKQQQDPPKIIKKKSINLSSKMMIRWTILLVVSGILLLWIEKRFVLDVATSQQSEAYKTAMQSFESSVLRNSISNGDGTVLVDVREEDGEVAKDGFHPQSILLPLSKIRRFVQKEFLYKNLKEYFLMRKQQLVSLSTLDSFGALLVEIAQDVPMLVDLLFTPHDFQTESRSLFTIESFLRQVQLLPISQKKFLEEHYAPENVGKGNDQKKEADPSFDPVMYSAEKLKNAKTIVVICSYTGVRSQVAAVWLRSILSAAAVDNKSITVVSLNENFYQLVPDNLRFFGMVRKSLRIDSSREELTTKREAWRDAVDGK
jgi:rhodanese-related sulfurtransferase